MSEYLDQYKLMHEDPDRYPGDSLQIHANAIYKLISETGSKSLLDYGCGKGYQYTKKNLHVHHFGGIMPALYDPAVETHNVLPEGKFDGVISTDVMEHIPEQELDDALRQIYSKADKFVYLGICTVLAQAILPNGENAHCTVKPVEWWINKIEPHATVDTTIYCYGGRIKTTRHIKVSNGVN